MDRETRPVAGVDYPRTFQEMDDWFRDEAACRDYVRRLRWPAGFVCPHCGAAGEAWIMSDDLMRCRSCHRRTSLTAGTIFEGTRKPLRTWFMAMWFVTSQKNGVSALGLQRTLGLASSSQHLSFSIVHMGRQILAHANVGKWRRHHGK